MYTNCTVITIKSNFGSHEKVVKTKAFPEKVADYFKKCVIPKFSKEKVEDSSVTTYSFPVIIERYNLFGSSYRHPEVLTIQNVPYKDIGCMLSYIENTIK